MRGPACRQHAHRCMTLTPRKAFSMGIIFDLAGSLATSTGIYMSRLPNLVRDVDEPANVALFVDVKFSSVANDAPGVLVGSGFLQNAGVASCFVIADVDSPAYDEDNRLLSFLFRGQS